MMKHLKKIAAVFITVLLVFSSVDFALADSGWDGLTETKCGGTGDPNNPYLISTPENLAWFRTQVNNGDITICAKLTADIDLNDKPWIPIGGKDVSVDASMLNKKQNAYSGTFDGDGHTISGLYISIETDSTNYRYIGLFGAVVGTRKSGVTTYAEIKNLKVKGIINIFSNTGNAPSNIAGICGCSYYTKISDCVSDVNITLSGTNEGALIGGFVGYAYSKDVVLTNCINVGNISGNIVEVGGLIGSGTGTSVFSNCCNYGNISGNNKVGGLCGAIAGEYRNCYNTGIVTATDTTSGSGGLVGYTPQVVYLYNCFSFGKCSFISDNYTGAVCGMAQSAYANSFSNVYYLEGICSKPFGINSAQYTVTEMNAEGFMADSFVETLNLNAGSTVFKKGASHPIFVWQTEDAPIPVVILGDIDENGMVNAEDVSELIVRIANNNAPDATVADMNGDGMVNAEDVIGLIMVITTE